MRAVIAFGSGLLFALGLVISGMTQPAKVIGFLDFAGAWDASLAFVMMGALAVHFVAYRIVQRSKAPVFAPAFEIPTVTAVDRRLVLGSAIFGVGWGLAGYCPGPVLVSIGSAMLAPLTLLGGMIAGTLLFDWWMVPKDERDTSDVAA